MLTLPLVGGQLERKSSVRVLHVSLLQEPSLSEQTECPGFLTKSFFEQGQSVALVTTGNCSYWGVC